MDLGQVQALGHGEAGKADVDAVQKGKYEQDEQKPDQASGDFADYPLFLLYVMVECLRAMGGRARDNYADLAKLLVENAKGEPVDLLETLAARLLDMVMNMGGGDATGLVRKAKITVHKPNAPIVYDFEDVSVTVKASRE